MTPVTGSEAPTHAPEPEPMADAEEPMIAEGDISFVGEDEPALLDYGSAHERWRTSGVGSRTPVAELTAIDAGIAAIERLEVEPLAQPVVIRETEIVPVETLLYRGRGALTRAIELRDELRRQSAARDEPKLDELFDLLDLALTE